MEFLCLGPIAALRDGVPVQLGEPQRRLVLALLLTHANSVVSTDRLVDGIWGENPPENGRKIVQGYVSGLRKTLGPEHAIESSSPGYRLSVKPGEFDGFAFESLIEEGIASIRTNPQHAKATLTEALALWRGDPYEDLADFDILRPEITRLEQLHLGAIESKIEAEILSGDARVVATELGDLTRRFPLRERLWSLRILALYRTSRQSEALRVYEEARQSLASELGLEPSAQMQLLEQRILEHDPVLDTLAALDPTSAEHGPNTRNPYKGLRAFTEEDAGDFFGRASLVRRLREMLDRRNVPRLLVLAGPSGSGKSSVIGAGLIPKLRDDGWSVTTMYPGSVPGEALESARNYFAAESKSVLVVDQLEESITLGTPESRDLFLNRLADLVSEEDGPWVLVTVRADFLDRLLLHARFARLVEPGLVLVTPLETNDVRDAIVRPASLVGLTVEPDLVASMVVDVGNRAQVLPLLQYALTDLYDRSADGRLTLRDLEAAGGISGALAKRADAIYEGLDEAGQSTIRQLFLRLVTLTGEGEVLRRRATTDSLSGLPDVDAVLAVFGHHRLLSFDRDQNGQPTVEVAHEAFLREWPRLAGWIEDARDSLRMLERLTDAAEEWNQNERASTYLLVGARLARYQGWEVTDLTLSRNEEEFLAASRERDETERTQIRRRRRWIMGGFAAAALVALVFGVLALFNARVAGERAVAARAEALAASARAVIEEDPELSVLLGIEALELAPNSAAASSALDEALQAHRTVFALSGDDPAHGSISPDGSILAVVTGKESRTLEVWEVGESSKPLWSYDTAEDEGGFGTPLFTEDGSQVLVYARLGADRSVLAGVWTIYVASNGQVDHRIEIDPCLFPPLWSNTTTGFVDLARPILMLRNPDDSCTYPQISEAELVAVDLGTGVGEKLGLFDNHFLIGVPTMSADGTRYAVASGGKGGVFDFESNELILPLPAGMSTLSPDGSLVLSGNDPIRLVHVATGDLLREYPGSYSRAYFSASGRQLIAASVDGSTRVFDTFGGQLLFELRGSASRELTVQITADERYVATFAGDGSARVWDVGSPLFGTASPAVYKPTENGFMPARGVLVAKEHVIVPIGREGSRETAIYATGSAELIRTLPGRALAVSPDESTLVMQSWPGADQPPNYEGSVTFYQVGALVVVDIATGNIVREFDGPCVWYNSPDAEEVGPGCGDYPQPWVEWSRSGSFSPDGSLFAMGGYSGYVVVWDVTSGEIVKFVDSLLGGSQTLSGLDGWALVEFSPSGDDMAVHQFEQSTNSKVLYRLNTTTWEVDAEIADLNQPVNEMSYTPDGSSLVIVDAATNLVLIDAESWKETAILEGQQGSQLDDVDVSPNGRFAATASPRGWIWVWDLETESVVHRWEFPAASTSGGVVNVAFVDDRTILASGELAAVLLTLDPQVLLDHAKSRVTRTMTEQECATYEIACD